MKRIMILLVACIMPMLFQAQDISIFNPDPNSMWPYLFNDFKGGTVCYKDGTKSQAPINFHLLTGELQFVQGDVIMKVVKPDQIDRIEVDGFVFVQQAGNYYEQLKQDNGLSLLKKIKGNLNDLIESTGAYGSKGAVSATTDLSSFRIGIGGVTNLSHQAIKLDKNNGKSFSVKISYYFLYQESLFDASKKGIQFMFPDNKKEIDQIIKKHKIKFSNEESLRSLVDLIYVFATN